MIPVNQECFKRIGAKWSHSCLLMLSSPAPLRLDSCVLCISAAQGGPRLTFRSNTLQEYACRLVVRVLRHELTLKRFGEDCLVQMINQLAGVGRLGGEAVHHSKGGIYSLNKSLGIINFDHWYPKSF